MSNPTAYVLTREIEYEGTEVLGVFTSPESAKAWLKATYNFESKWRKYPFARLLEEAPITPGYDYFIAEWEVT